MAAQPAPWFVEVDKSTGMVTYKRKGDTFIEHWTVLDKVAKIALAKFLGFKFTGMTPLRWDLADINTAISDCLSGSQNLPTVKPKPTKSAPRQEDIMNQPKVEKALQDLMDAVQSQGVDREAVLAIVNEAVDPLGRSVDAIAVDVASVIAQVGDLTDAVAKVRPQITQVHIQNQPVKELHGVQHAVFPKVLSALGARLSIMMVGPAGTGKTTIASRASEALGLEFSSKSCTSQTTESSLVGFIHAGGEYVGTEFRKRFEHGGVFLLDEVDNANPNVLGVLNSALANGTMAFPDGMVKRHADFVCIAAGNTYGNGATAEYVGRNPIDAATKDRFVFVDVNIDEAVEGAMLDAVGLDATIASRWLSVVRQARSNVQTYGLKVIVSPRATEGGARLLSAGWTLTDVVDATILKGAKPDQVAKILEGVTL